MHLCTFMGLYVVLLPIVISIFNNRLSNYNTGHTKLDNIADM